jgi:2-polyprenyl-3-methyl-5-hydroxy-6-metoxy-1,4-benzoquinol methylase
MAQVTTGIRAILSHPMAYEAVQRIMGAKKGRTRIVREFLRPFPGMRILDLGCGMAEILGALPTDVSYVGYDMSAEYISAARRKYAGRGTFHCRPLEHAEVATLDRFDLVMGIGVLHHLDDATARQFVRIASAALNPDGRIYTLDPCFAARQNPIARFLISRDRGQNVRDPEGYQALLQGLELKVHGTLTHQAWIPYTHWHMECRVQAPISRIGT